MELGSLALGLGQEVGGLGVGAAPVGELAAQEVDAGGGGELVEELARQGLGLVEAALQEEQLELAAAGLHGQRLLLLELVEQVPGVSEPSLAQRLGQVAPQELDHG